MDSKLPHTKPFQVVSGLLVRCVLAAQFAFPALVPQEFQILHKNVSSDNNWEDVFF